MEKRDYINILPLEILTCIFTCLHAKSLGMSKCVSKSWNFLISDPHFIKAHLTKTSITKLILLSAEPEDDRYSERERSLYTVHFNNNNGGVASRLNFNLFTYCDNKNKNMWSRVWGSCDGLILVEDHRKCMFVLNPTTLESNMLPLLRCRYRSSKNTCNLFGFGYDSGCDDYAVVAIVVYKYEEKDAFVYIYTLKTKQWKEVGPVASDFLGNEHAAGILGGGSIYWLAANSNNLSLLIVAFNIANKELSRIPVPNGIFDSRCGFWRLGIHEGCLCLINMNVYDTIAELWVMQEDGAIRSCIKLLIVVDGYSCSMPSKDNLVMMGFYKPFLLVSGAGRRFSGAMEGRMYRYMKVYGLPYEFEVGISFVESLVSPNNWGEYRKNRGRRSKTTQCLG